MNKYEELAIKMLDNVDQKDLESDWVFFKTEELKEDEEQYKKMLSFYEEC